jgi:hypothetical protein
VYRYYQILELQPGASKEQVKRAYRRLALKYHPDLNKDVGAKERFLLISEAYNYLSNPPKVSFASTTTAEQKSRAEAERVKRAKAAATKAARQRYAEFKHRKEIAQSRAYSQAITSLVAILLFGAATFFGYKYFNQWYVNQLPDETICTVIQFTGRHYWVAYEVDGEEHIKKISGFRSHFNLLAPNGMPIFKDEQFVIVYRKDNPKRCYVDYNRITPQTMNVYLALVAPHVWAQFKLSQNDTRVECISLLTFNTYGIEGLADLFFWEESFLENMGNNSITCRSMVGSTDFQEILDQCMMEENND